MFGLFKKTKKEKPPYLERIDELEKLSIIRLKGLITRDMVPIIEMRIQENRKEGSGIDKNVLVDFALVEDVDSSTIAFHLVHLEEYRARGFKVGFININKEFKDLLDIFKKNDKFKVFANEKEAVKELSR